MAASLNPQDRIKLVAWLAAYAVLAGVIGTEVDWGRAFQATPVLPKPELAPRPDVPIAPEFALPPLEQAYAETTVRPMLLPSRRPALSANQAQSAMRKGQFVLLGSLITGGSSIALLRDVANGKTFRVEQGKEIRGITVATVLPERVILRQQDDSEELTLKIQPAVAARTMPGQPAPLPQPPMPIIPPPQPAPVAAPALIPAPTPARTAAPPSAPAVAKAPPPVGGMSDGKGGFLDPADLFKLGINKRRAAAGLPPL